MDDGFLNNYTDEMKMRDGVPTTRSLLLPIFVLKQKYQKSSANGKKEVESGPAFYAFLFSKARGQFGSDGNLQLEFDQI
jgi:hypothetical protein